MNPWKRVTEMLQAYREQQRAMWGEVDDVAVARYLAGTCTLSEKDAVEKAAKDHEAVAELLQVLHAIAAAPEGAEDPGVVVVPFPGMQEDLAAAAVPFPGVPLSPIGAFWDVAGMAARLFEGLTARLDEAGRVVAEGLKAALAPPEPVFALQMKEMKEKESDRPGEAVWTIPLPDAGGQLTLTVAPDPSPGEWTVQIKVDMPAGVELDKGADLKITDEHGDDKSPGPLADFLDRPIFLTDGVWQVKLVGVAHRELSFPLTLGRPRSGSPG